MLEKLTDPKKCCFDVVSYSFDSVTMRDGGWEGVFLIPRCTYIVFLLLSLCSLSFTPFSFDLFSMLETMFISPLNMLSITLTQRCYYDSPTAPAFYWVKNSKKK